MKKQIARFFKWNAGTPGCILGFLLAERIIKIHTGLEFLLILSLMIALFIIMKAISSRLNENTGYWPKPLWSSPPRTNNNDNQISPTPSA
jgi:hypothetical protein